jgi:hypothetical protein
MSNYFEIEELAAHIMGVTEDYEESNTPSEFIENELYDKFEINLDQFKAVADKLLPLATTATSLLTGKTYRGFADESTGWWLVKKEVK